MAGISLDEYLHLRASGMKRCRVCKSWKAVGEYAKDRSRHDGCKSKCFTCDRVAVRVNTKGRVSTFKGRTHSPEARAKISAVHKGKPGPNKGEKRPPEFGRRVSMALRTSPHVKRGSDHYAWKGGAAERSKDARRSPEYREWRTAVFRRDGFACTRCGDDRGGNLEAHHIKSFADHPEIRFDVANGTTLCTACHTGLHFKADSIRNRRKRKRGEPLWA